MIDPTGRRGRDLDAATRAWLDAVAVEGAASAELLARARANFGATPAARLEWVLRFAYPDPRALVDPERLGLLLATAELVRVATDGRWSAVLPVRWQRRAVSSKGDRTSWGKLPASTRRLLELYRAETRAERTVVYDDLPPSADLVALIEAAQRAARETVEAIAAGAHGILSTATAELLARVGGVKSVAAFPLAAQARVDWYREAADLVVRTTLTAPLPDALRAAIVVLASQIPATLLRRCAFRSPGVCGQVFVGRKRQKYCAAHRDAARQEQLRKAQERYARRTRAARRRAKR